MQVQVWAEVLTIGSELVLGQLIDTNAAYIAAALAEIGVGLACHTTVGDDRERMKQAMEQALSRCQIVITTGGIGPTEDDLTREVAAEVFGRELVLKPELLEYIEKLFARLNYKMAPNNRRQAYIPDGATAIHNPRGTAPAFRYEQGDRVMICLPGVPFETEPLIREEILPFLKDKYDLQGRIWVNRVLKVCGVGESNVDAQIKEIIRSSKNPVIGLQASPGEIKVRLTAMAENQDEARALLDDGEARIREKLGPLIFGYGDDTLAQTVARLLKKNGKTLAVAEALTQGLVCADLGKWLSPDRLKGGIVSGRPQSAQELDRKLKEEFQADLNLVISGLPDDQGQAEVHIQVLGPDGQKMERTLEIGGAQRIVRQRSATIALFTLFRFLSEAAEADV